MYSELLRRWIWAEDSTSYEAAKVHSQPAATCEESRPSWPQGECSARIHSNALGEFSAVAGETWLYVSVLTVQVRTVEALQCRLVALHHPQQRTSVRSRVLQYGQLACALSGWLGW